MANLFLLQSCRPGMLEAGTQPGRARALVLAAFVVLLSLGACDNTGPAYGTGSPAPQAQYVPPTGNFCTATVDAQFASCENEAGDDLHQARAICINVAEEAERSSCFDQTATENTAGLQRCQEQRTARGNLCAVLGEDRYEPPFEASLFDDDFGSLTHPNPYRPLGIGNQWEYEGDGETVAIEVLDKTKLIAGVTCIIVRDQVFDEGELIEDTLDWFAQAKNGDVFYCGEEVKDYESFDGDSPREPELVSIDGAFKHGRDGDKGGILFPGVPVAGAVFRQEFSPGNAEDVAEILSTSYRYGAVADLDRHVPAALAMLLCSSGDCVVTREFSPLHPEPDGTERKYYAAGIGLFLELKPESGEVVQLVDCNVDSRCAALPAPP